MSMRAIPLLCALALAGCKQRPSSDAETDGLVRQALTDEGCRVEGQEGRTIRATCGDGGVSTIALENLDEMLKSIADPAERKLKVARFVHQLLVAQNESAPDTVPLAALRPSLKTKAAIEATFARVPPEARAKNRLPTWPVAGDVIAVVVIDRAENMALVMQPMLEKWNASGEMVYAKAIANLDAHPLTPKKLVRGGATLAVLDDPQDAYEAARVLSPKARGDLEKLLGGHAVFAIPDREHLAAARADDEEAVRELRALAREHVSDAYGITADILEADATGKLRNVP